MLNYSLLTKYGENSDINNVLKEYPRPRFKRNSYYSLNGLWQYSISKKNNYNYEFKDNLIVLFPIESILSKVRKELKKDELLIYKKRFDLPKDFIKENTFINFGAVDN